MPCLSRQKSLRGIICCPNFISSRYTTEEPYVPSGTRVKHDALKSNHRTPHMESTYKMNPPKYSISSLKRSMLTPKQLLEKNHVDQHPVNIEPLHNKTVISLLFPPINFVAINRQYFLRTVTA